MIWKIWKISVLVIITPKESSSSSSSLRPPTPAVVAAAAIHTYHRAASASTISLKFHPKHVTNKNKTKHIMKISHINVNIWKLRKKSKLNSEKIWKIRKKSKMNSEKIWTFRKGQLLRWL